MLALGNIFIDIESVTGFRLNTRPHGKWKIVPGGTALKFCRSRTRVWT
jgi:hypothetical protein